MAQALGSRTSLQFVEEVTYGTTPVAPGAGSCFKIPFTSESLAQEIANFVSQEIRADRTVPYVVQGNKRVQGQINIELGSDSHARLIKHALGPTVATAGGGPYTHIIKGQNVLPVGFTLEKAFNDLGQFFLYKGCKINRLTMNFPQEGFITASVDILGREETTSGATIQASPTSYSEDPYTSFEAVLSEATHGVSFASLATVQAASFSLVNGIKEDNFVIGDRRRYTEPEGRRVITGQLTVFFEDLTLYNKFVNGTTAKLLIVATKGTNTFTVYFPKVVYAGASPTPRIPNDGPMVLTMPFQAVYDSAENTDIKFTFVNDVATIA